MSVCVCVCLLSCFSCVWLCDPTECSPPGSSTFGILQARILEWVAMPSSKGSSQPRDRTQVSHIAGRFFTIWATREAQEYWSRVTYPSPEGLPNPGTEPPSPALYVDLLPSELPGNLQNLVCYLAYLESTESSRLRGVLFSFMSRILLLKDKENVRLEYFIITHLLYSTLH